MFPGVKITGPQFQSLTKEILHQLNPNQVSPIENLSRWIRVDHQVYGSDALTSSDSFYLFYCHPVHKYLDKLYLTNQADLVVFLRARIDSERGNGLDLIIASLDMSHLIVCNHDGEVYVAR
jgi:hypothetical protein